MLFRREVEVEPLDTPERRAGLKGRLRQAAAAIQDKDLAEQYRRALARHMGAPDEAFRLDLRFGEATHRSALDALAGHRNAARWAVAGIICISPRAPACDMAVGSKALSWRTRPITRKVSILPRLASSMSE